jgi:hypothetical protein
LRVRRRGLSAQHRRRFLARHPRTAHKAEAIATVPDEWVDLKSPVGPPARIRERYRAWEEIQHTSTLSSLRYAKAGD